MKIAMEITTQRLRIIPLEPEQFKLLLEATEKMERALCLNASNESLDEHTQRAMEWLYQQMIENRQDYLWYTNWQTILREKNISIGSACFMGRPNEKGEIEVGYGIHAPYRCHGYMTEAMQAICGWALKQPSVLSITAETEKDNISSGIVLQRCGMSRVGETNQNYIWRRKDKP